MKITNTLKTISIGLISTLCTAIPVSVFSQNQLTQDTCSIVTAKGSADPFVLKNAPSASINIMGSDKYAKFVVDLNTNTLYKYNTNGEATCAYKIASGKKSTPTDKGIRIVTHVETYPYRSAPARTKRRRNPKAYGPKIICLNKLNPKTGEQSPTGEFIHGNNNPSSIGKYASLGCMRMDNDVIKQLAKEVTKGDIVIIK